MMSFDVASGLHQGCSQVPIMPRGSVSVKKMAADYMILSLTFITGMDSLITRIGTALQPAGQLQGCSELVRLGQLTSMA